MADGYPTFVIGNKLTFDFKDITDGDGRAFDPPKVKFKYQAPGASVVIVNYPEAGTEHVEQGWFRLSVDLPYDDPTILGMWDGVALGLTFEDVTIIVRPQKFKVISDGLT